MYIIYIYVNVCMYVYILLLYYYYILYLSAHMQRTKQALGIAPHEALFKKDKYTTKVY